METRFLNIEYLFGLIYRLLTGGGADNSSFYVSDFFHTLTTIWITYSVLATIVSLILGAILVYSFLRLRQIRKSEEKYYATAMQIAEEDEHSYKNEAWEHVEQLAQSDSENDWRQAIMEADIMLDSMLTAQGYYGETIGEKLKQVEPADFRTLNLAWEAHKVRNKVAHEGTAYVLTEREVRQVTGWFREVFNEFELI